MEFVVKEHERVLSPLPGVVKAGRHMRKRPASISREVRETVGQATVENARMTCRNVNVYYGGKQAIRDVTLDIGRNEVLAMIGPSGCGKSTFLRCITARAFMLTKKPSNTKIAPEVFSTKARSGLSAQR